MGCIYTALILAKLIIRKFTLRVWYSIVQDKKLLQPCTLNQDRSKALKEARVRQSSSSIIVSSTVQEVAKAKNYSRARRAAYWDCTTEAPMRLYTSHQTKAAIDC